MFLWRPNEKVKGGQNPLEEKGGGGEGGKGGGKGGGREGGREGGKKEKACKPECLQGLW